MSMGSNYSLISFADSGMFLMEILSNGLGQEIKAAQKNSLPIKNREGVFRLGCQKSDQFNDYLDH